MSDQTPDAGLPDLSSLLGGGGGGGGLGDLLAGAQQAMAASQAAAAAEVEGSAGGGVVRIRANGAGHVLAVSIAPEVVDPADVEGLEDLVLAALHDVTVRIGQLHTDAMGGFDPSAMLSGFFGGTDSEEE